MLEMRREIKLNKKISQQTNTEKHEKVSFDCCAAL